MDNLKYLMAKSIVWI